MGNLDALHTTLSLGHAGFGDKKLLIFAICTQGSTSNCGLVSTPSPDRERPVHVCKVILDVLLREFPPHEPLCIIDGVGRVQEHLRIVESPSGGRYWTLAICLRHACQSRSWIAPNITGLQISSHLRSGRLPNQVVLVCEGNDGRNRALPINLENMDPFGSPDRDATAGSGTQLR